MSDRTLASQVTRALDVSHAYVAEGRFKEAERSLRTAVELAAAVRRTAPPGDGTGPAAMRNARFELDSCWRPADAPRKRYASSAPARQPRQLV